MTKRPTIVLVGGALRPASSTEKALRLVMNALEQRGARTELITGKALDLPMFAPEASDRTADAAHWVEALRGSDGVVVGAPGYHGSLSGLMKNVLDYVEDLRADVRPYLSGRAVGLIATGGGWAGAVNTLGAMRDIVHALRGWPTPLGVAINTSEPVFDADGACIAQKTATALETLADEVLEFARLRQSA